jgi:hypothetical protein
LAEKEACRHKQSMDVAKEKKEPCPICEYHFPLNVVPEVSLYQCKNTFIESSITELQIRLPFQQFVSIKSPRAPPDLI